MEMLLKCPGIDTNIPFLSMEKMLLSLVDVKVLGILWSHKDIDKSVCINILMDKQPLLCIKFMSEIGGLDDVNFNDISDDIVRDMVLNWDSSYMKVLEKIISNWTDVRLNSLLKAAVGRGVIKVVKMILDRIVELNMHHEGNMSWMLNIAYKDVVKVLLSDDRVKKLLEDDDYTTKKLEERNYINTKKVKTNLLGDLITDEDSTTHVHHSDEYTMPFNGNYNPLALYLPTPPTLT